jgi:hypothetical protein
VNLEVPGQWVRFRSEHRENHFLGLLIWVCYKVVSELLVYNTKPLKGPATCQDKSCWRHIFLLNEINGYGTMMGEIFLV